MNERNCFAELKRHDIYKLEVVYWQAEFGVP
jgi:hypothetical protein